MSNFLQKTCLKEHYSLRRQLLTSFGLAAICTLGATVTVSIAMLIKAGDVVKERSVNIMRSQVHTNLVDTTISQAETMNKFHQLYSGLVEQMAEFAQDRIVGYPEPGWEQDLYVPFTDMTTGNNKYPIQADPVPLDWQLSLPVITKENVANVMPGREEWFEQAFPFFNYQGGVWHIQGTCDADLKYPTWLTYLPNCTDANNDLTTGGALYPTATAYGLYQKSAELVLFLRAMFESNPDIGGIGMFFFNEGAGASLKYPGHPMNGLGPPYVSEGCDWMLETINPHTGKPIATPEQVARCRPKGELVPGRLYNPAERAWFRAAVENQGQVTWMPPFFQYGFNIYITVIAKAVFDRKTGNFIGVTSIDITVPDLSKELADWKLYNHSEIGVADFQTGQIITDSLYSTSFVEDPITGLPNETSAIVTWQDLGILSDTAFENMKTIYTDLFTTKKWTRESILEAAASTVTTVPYGTVVSFPLPIPPEEYDEDYAPTTLVMQVISNEAYAAIDEIDDEIESDVLRVSVGIGIIAAVGMFVIFVVVFFVAYMLTKPLLWMELVSSSIVNHEGDQENLQDEMEDLSNQRSIVSENDTLRILGKKESSFETHIKNNQKLKAHKAGRLTPNTEITELVQEFYRMITGFSGEGAAATRDDSNQENEVRNNLTWQSDYRQLYNRKAPTQIKTKIVRLTSGNSSSQQTPHTVIEGSLESTEITDENKVFPVVEENEVSDFPEREKDNVNNKDTKASWSLEDAGEMAVAMDEDGKMPPSAFMANTIFPAPPKQNFGPSAAASQEDRNVKNRHGREIPAHRSRLFRWIVMLIVLPLVITNGSIAFVATTNILSTIPDWVDSLFESSIDLEVAAQSSLVRSEASHLTKILKEVARDSHMASRIAGWLFFGAVNRTDSFTVMNTTSEACKSYGSADACPLLQLEHNCLSAENSKDVSPELKRKMQHQLFAVLAQDFDPLTGDRLNGTSYDQTAYSPASTAWQADPTGVPGSRKGTAASGFTTTYDRLRVSSALSAVNMPLFNYNRRNSFLGTYLAFEADGLITGFDGCSHIDANFPFFVSSQENKAFEMNEEMCPEGKYGLDARCRSWFVDSQKQFTKSNQMTQISPPYMFVDGTIGMSASSALANPATGEFAGSIILDYGLDMISDALKSLKGKFTAFVITPDFDVFGNDIVLGPKGAASWKPSSIIDELFEHDEAGSPRRNEFESGLLKDMKTGGTGDGKIYRERPDGSIEGLSIVYAPVFVNHTSAIDPTSLVHGVNTSTNLIYSVAIMCAEDVLEQPFSEAEKSINDDLRTYALIDLILAVVFSALFLLITCLITLHVTKPMITLLNAVQSITHKETRQDLPPLQGGSREVQQVYNSFAKLYKVVQISNTAFFSGNVELANRIVIDAIQLFRKMNDEKAIGIACNNMANILFARTMELGIESQSSINVAIVTECYDEAVFIGQKHFEQGQTVEEKAALACELSDRLFNRGLWHLFLETQDGAPNNSRQLGLDDILQARDFHYDVKDFYIEHKLLLQYSDVYFSRMLHRIHGLCSHYRNDDLIQIWDPSRLVDEADELLLAAWFETSAPVFDEINRTGRRQQLEGAAIHVECCKGKFAKAARLSMRMFAEDEYLLEQPFSFASSCLLQYGQSNIAGWTPQTLTSLRTDLRRMSRMCRTPTLDMGRCVIFALELNERIEVDEIFPVISHKCLNLYDHHCSHQDYIGLVAYSTVTGDHTLQISSKAGNQAQQRAMLERATKSTCERVCSALPFAMQVVLDSCIPQEMDSYILLFTDGYSWDSGPYNAIKQQISEMNKDQESNVHMIILGVDVEPEHVDECRAMCTVSKESFFVELTHENIDQTFAHLSSLFSRQRVFQEHFSCSTMEKF